ncbi:hypothetical protein [Roseinatronobacter monicus]|uniref:Uncharacterized protein n=1 Tax=Roseinatronobacter monicus TaxID=393481 RepID=A0A543K9W0_9RHOB|nr:hypothetical protein [Roseinatronobacter monicus]TQM91875.1 hypothetical protein BD293_0451 [Roseinatronobacter monicus]
MRKGIVVRNSQSVLVSGNHVHNADIAYDFEGVENLTATGNKATWDIDPILIQFPVLQDAEENDLVAAANAVAAASPDERVNVLRGTKLGQWLAQQAFLDWAVLAVALIGLTQ